MQLLAEVQAIRHIDLVDNVKRLIPLLYECLPNNTSFIHGE